MSHEKEVESTEEVEARAEAREDSLEFVSAVERQAFVRPSVKATIETHAMISPNVKDDAADDMAIWFNAASPGQSLIFGANKKHGISVYNLSGEEIAFYPTGRINNIDVMLGFDLNGSSIDLVGCTNRSDQSIDLLRILPDGKLTDIAVDQLFIDTTILYDIYGFCFYKGSDPFLFVNGKSGVMQQYKIVATAEGKLILSMVRQVEFSSQTEGMVADEDHGILYVGEEDAGIWKLLAEPHAGDERILVKLSDESNPNIRYDIEGLTIYQRGDYGYLIASSQGNFSYAVFERTGGNKYLGSFKIVDGDSIDGVEETDGIDVLSVSLGDTFPHGLFIAQDGFNYSGDTLDRQNFKLVPWERIAAALDLR